MKLVTTNALTNSQRKAIAHAPTHVRCALCRRWFLQDRADKRYCNRRCAYMAAQRKYRKPMVES